MGVAGAVASQNIRVIKGPAVSVSMKIVGDLQMTSERLQQLEDAVAYTLGLPPALVEVLSFKYDGQRRLLAVLVTFRILATNQADAAQLQRKAAAADFASAFKAQIGADITVSDVTADITQSVESTPAPAGSNSSYAGAVGAAVGVVGIVLLGGVVFAYMYRRRKFGASRWGFLGRRDKPASLWRHNLQPGTFSVTKARSNNVLHEDGRSKGAGIRYVDTVRLATCSCVLPFTPCCVVMHAKNKLNIAMPPS